MDGSISSASKFPLFLLRLIGCYKLISGLFYICIHQVADSQVTNLCMEAQECMVMGRWLDLASLMLTSADLVFSKVSEKGIIS